MANKKSKKKAQQKVDESAAVTPEKATAKKDVAKKDAAKKAAAPAKKADKKADKKKNAKPGFIARTKAYFMSVRSEMKRCVWPSKKELINYSVAVCVSLIVVGVAIALVDAVISQGLVLFAGLRG